jgi:hypothetical protein
MAAGQGHETMVRCFVEEFGADVDQAACESITPLMAASGGKERIVAKYL